MDAPRSLRDLDERVLLLRIEAGDVPAAAEFVRRYEKGLILPAAYRILRNRADAQELPGAVFLRLLNLKEGRAEKSAWPPEHVPAWLKTLVEHLALDMKRSRDAERKRHVHQYGWSRPAALPDEEAERSEMRRQLAHRLADLTAEEREVIDLQIVHDLPVARVCELTGMSRATVYRLRERGLKRLREDERLYFLVEQALDSSEPSAEGA